MAKQTFTTGQVLTAAQVNSLQTNDFNQTVSVKTAAYVLAAADKGTRIEFNTSGSVTCTVNTGLFDAGDTVIIQNRGAGDVTVTAGTATVNTAGSLVLSQYQSGTLYFISASASIFFAAAVGDLTAVTSGTGISISNAGGPVPTITNSMATEISAKGDLIVGTGSGTFDNLTVGTNGHTLVADSSTATGLKWAAASSGGMTSLSSGNLNGLNTVSFTSISGSYNNLELHIPSYNLNAATRLAVRINNDTGANYFGFWIRNRNNTFGSGVYPGTTYILGDGEVTPVNDTNNGSVIFRFPSYTATAGRKVIEVVGHSNDSNVVPFYSTFVYNGTAAAITRIDIITVGGQNYTAGSYILYGVK